MFAIVVLKDQERRTPLHAAAWLGDVHIMDLLITAGDYLLDFSARCFTCLGFPLSIMVLLVLSLRCKR